MNHHLSLRLKTLWVRTGFVSAYLIELSHLYLAARCKLPLRHTHMRATTYFMESWCKCELMRAKQVRARNFIAPLPFFVNLRCLSNVRARQMLNQLPCHFSQQICGLSFILVYHNCKGSPLTLQQKSYTEVRERTGHRLCELPPRPEAARTWDHAT